MQRWLTTILAIWPFLVIPGSGPAPQKCSPLSLRPGNYTFTLHVEGQRLNRVYDLHVPAGVSRGDPMPLVVDIHAFTRNKEDQARRSGFKSLADANGFLVAYPQGINNQWNAGDAIMLGDPDIDDVAFIRAVVADVARRVRI